MAESLKIWLPALRVGSGSDVFTTRLAEGLERAGHQPLLQWFSRRYELMPWFLSVIPAPEGVDVIHAGSWQGFVFKRPGIPLVVTEHHDSANPELSSHQGALQKIYHRHFVQRCNRKSYSSADALVAVSEFSAAAMRKRLSIDIQVVHNWIDSERFRPGSLCPGSSSRPFRLLFVGNPSRWKGFDVLPGLSKRLGRGYQISCLGGLRRGYAGRESGSGLSWLPGVAPEKMPEIYRGVDAVLVPTRYETFGYVALEAMACGLPVVGFKSSGTAEVCVHDETALLSPVDDIEKLERNIRRLASDERLRKRLGEAGRARACSLFSEEKAISRYLDIYECVRQKVGVYE